MPRRTSHPGRRAHALFGSLVVGAACGNDVARDRVADPDDPDRPDAGVAGDGASRGTDGGVTPDGALTVCDEAKLHSDFAWIQANVLTPSCATATCHAGPEPDVGLTLEAGTAYPNLVDKGASTATGWTRVVPGSLAQSYLVVSLGRAEGPPPRDGFMPLGADPLCIEKLEAIERWILAGAPP